jgi:2-dehydropantoate 2-reductase
MNHVAGKSRISKVAVVGLGGVGGYFGGLLARRYHERVERQGSSAADVKVSFVARGAHLEAIARDGLLLNTDETGLVCRPASATDDIAGLERPELWLVCVKGYDLEEVSRRLGALAAEHTLIMPLLNGVDIRERIRRHVDTGIVLPACAYVSASIERPGVVRQMGMPGVLVFGRDPDNPGWDPSPAVELFQEAGIAAKYEQDAYPSIWQKFLFIASFGLVTAWADKSLGGVLEDGQLRQLVMQIMQEIRAVAGRRGVAIAEAAAAAAIEKAEAFPYDTKTSYQRDVEKGGRNEGELFGGAVIRLGRELGVPIPVTQRVYGEICGRLQRAEP